MRLKTFIRLVIKYKSISTKALTKWLRLLWDLSLGGLVLSFIVLILYLIICACCYLLFRYLYKNRFLQYYILDEVVDTDESTFVTYETEENYRPYIDSYTIFINDDMRFFKAYLSKKVEYINFEVICYRNKKINKICNVLNEVRDKKEDFTIKIPDNCDEVKLRINEVNGKVFANHSLLKNNLFWRAIASSLICGFLSVGLFFVYELIFSPSVNDFFAWNEIFHNLFNEPLNYLYAATIGLAVSIIFFLCIYFPNLINKTKAKFNKVKKFKMKKIIKCKFKHNKKKLSEIIKLKIKGHKKFRSGKAKIVAYSKNNEILLEEIFDISKKHKKYSFTASDKVNKIDFDVISADFKKYYYEGKTFRVKQTKKGLEGHFLKLKGIYSATIVFCLSIGSTTGITMYEFSKIYQINNNMKHFNFVTNDDSTYSINDYKGKNSVVAIPAQYQNKNITKIEDASFAGKNSIKEVYFTNNLKIGNAAFANCKNLTKVEFGIDVEIGKNAFNSTKIKNLVFSNNEVIGEGAFSSINTLKNVYLSGTLTLGDQAFAYSNIEYLEVYPNSFELPKSAFKNTFVKKGYIYEGSTLSPYDLSVIFSKGSKIKIQNKCVHDSYSFITRGGKIIDNYSYKDFQIVSEPTCLNSGVKEVVCDYCKEHYFVTTRPNPNNHSYSEGVCIYCGANDPNYKNESTETVTGGEKNAY